jgi:ubiquinone/menaquinone biosynthesis C-methylase UbiE
MVKVARANAEKNGISKKCNFLCSSFENLPYRDISFDLAVGAYILHHVDVERAAKELHRVLRPGGRAVFTETWGKNPLLIWAGKYLAGRFGIAKYGTKYEHPITTADIERMREVFSEVYLEFPEFIFFRKAATNVFRWKKNLKFITDVLVKMDNFITRRFPSFNKYGYYCVIELVKSDDEKPMTRIK